MFKSAKSFNNSFFGSFALEPIIARHQDHLLVRIKKAVSFEGINELVKGCYSTEGRHAYQPEMMFKILIIQFLYNLSDREVAERIDTDLVFRYFVGFSLSDDLPHFTKLGTFKDRLGRERFEHLFNLLVSAGRKSGLVSDELREIDTTDQTAKVNLAKLKRMFKTDKDDHTYIDRNSKDKDAGFGNKGCGRKKWYGYKAATLIEPDSQMITSLKTVKADTRDHQLTRPLVEKEIEKVGSKIEDLGGDKGFLGQDTRDVCRENGINEYITPRRNSVNYLEGKDTIGFYIARWKRLAVERVYGDTKRKQGLAKTRYLGLEKTSLMNILIFFAYNLKRAAVIIKEQADQGLSPPLSSGVLRPFLTD